jgi:hypothetical protein
VNQHRKIAIEAARLRDEVVEQLMQERNLRNPSGVIGWGFYELFDIDSKLKQYGVFANKITDVGDEVYAKRAANVATTLPTGMRLGTGSTAPAKNGAGAAIVTYVSSITASKAIDGSFPTAATLGAGAGWRVQYKTSWSAGQATQNGWNEVVITNEASLTDVAGTAANTISRALLSPVVNKGANDTLAVTWNHDFLGA